MSCERYREAIADTAAGRPAAGGALDAHLDRCAACADELDRLRAALGMADAALREIADAEPSPALRARIRQAVAEDAGPRWSLAALRRWGLPAAVAVLLVVGIVEAVRSGGGRGASARPAIATVSPPPTASPLSPARAGSGSTTATPSGRSASRGDEPTAAAPARRPLRVAVGRHVAPPPGAAPAVIVAPGQEQQLRQLLAYVDRERVELPSLAAAGKPSPDLAEPQPIDIAPLEIVPLEAEQGSGT